MCIIHPPSILGFYNYYFTYLFVHFFNYVCICFAVLGIDLRGSNVLPLEVWCKFFCFFVCFSDRVSHFWLGCSQTVIPLFLPPKYQAFVILQSLSFCHSYQNYLIVPEIILCIICILSHFVVLDKLESGASWWIFHISLKRMCTIMFK
jgi:hypothetical protein